MPLTAKGEKIKSAMTRTYGAKKGKQVFYASANKGTITGVEKMGYGKKGKKHNSPADPDIVDAMTQGHEKSLRSPYKDKIPAGDKFVEGGGFKMVGDHRGQAMSYGLPKPASSPMVSKHAPRKSWRSRGDYDRRSRSES